MRKLKNEAWPKFTGSYRKKRVMKCAKTFFSLNLYALAITWTDTILLESGSTDFLKLFAIRTPQNDF